MEIASGNNNWVNTIDSNQPEIIQQVKRIITNNIYCSIATCSTEGIPWISPLFFAFDHNLNLYWSSAITSLHSQNIYSNDGRVAITIFDSSSSPSGVKGLYFSGTAQELLSTKVEAICQLFDARTKKGKSRQPQDYLNESPRRIYQFQPQLAWITGERLAIENILVDTKVEINLQPLIGSLSI